MKFDNLLKSKVFIIAISILLVSVSVAAVSGIRLKSWPYYLIFLSGTLLLSALAILWRKFKIIKITLVNLAVLMFFTTAIELFLTISEKSKEDGVNIEKKGSYYNISKKYGIPYNDTFGYRPMAGASVNDIVIADGKKVRDVSYTISSQGWRISPESKSDKCLIFFGCSMTYGEGLGNNETFAWICGEKTGYQVENFSFHGYGPHQMLSGIESGEVAKCVGELKPEYVIYTAIPHHPERCAGFTTWDAYGPKYVINNDGKPQRDGKFMSKYAGYVFKGVYTSKIFLKLMDANALMHRKNSVKLAAAVVARSAELLKEKYPKIKFIVFYWGKDDDYCKALKASGLKVIMLENAIEDYFKDLEKYQIPYDGHPNKLAARLVGEYLGQMINSSTKESSKKNK